ncbi:hypothetical protein G6O69_15040 [Pseudenhygromyxa sp. WMMC2535]|uniref:hypothetical protein n=1 Tax=Pseudenhygromyxa sp. WMMC2535 TaxID=2712867 RepID=UPI00155572CC|nr:hypothetical protein [Pseudenhygromyxa sp. WMMC2535]NVB39156.1 hypothetical protein [Pseudenhygromyxa sp. WMMC2535]
MSENFTWKRVDDILVTVATDGILPKEAWDQFIDALEREPVTKYLAISLGTINLSGAQRRQGAEILKRREITSFIITDDRLVRGIAIAVSWLGANAKAFPLKELPSVVESLHAESQVHQQTMATLEELTERLGKASNLQPSA